MSKKSQCTEDSYAEISQAVDAYAIVMCSSEYVGEFLQSDTNDKEKNAKETERSNWKRQTLASVVVISDSLIMGSLLIAIWLMEYLLKLDIFRHRNLLIEASEFAIKITNLP